MAAPRNQGRGKGGERHVAALEKRGRFAVVKRIFESGEQVPLDRKTRVRENQIVWAEFSRGRARIIKNLGRLDNARDVCEALALERLGRRGFSKSLEAAAERDAANPVELAGRRQDLTGLPTFTVDPASARDFDDAVSAKAEGDSLRLWIHIADVAAYIRPGSELDAEAALRANSTYVPTSVEPMLPLALSAGVCSLSPDVPRLAVTTEILLGPGGEVKKASFYRSLVCSDARLDYDELDRIFAGRHRAPELVAEPIELARRAAFELGSQRNDALEVNSSEPSFTFDADGNVTGAVAEAQTEAHRLIERLMVLTNESVAELLSAQKVPTLYRVHEQPDPDRISRLADQMASLDLPMPPVPDGLGPTEAGEVAVAASRMVAAEARRRGHGGRAWSSLILRSLKPARYSEANLGHAGLGSEAYCHFTSPIRRYADLIAHRGLLSTVGPDEERPDAGEVARAAEFCSDRERDASRLERDADDVCAAFLLERELYERGWKRTFEGEVSGVIGAGAFVTFGGEFGDVYEGMMPVRRIRDDRYNLNEQETALIGDKTGRSFRFGDPVTVTVDRVNVIKGRVDLDPVPDDRRKSG